MVSNSLHMELQELLALLEILKNGCADDPEYQELRGYLPDDWPL